MIGDHYRERWTLPLQPQMPGSPANPLHYTLNIGPPVTRQEFDALKHEVEQMKALLKRAKAYDEANNEPDCEIDEKMDLLRKVAKMVGVELDDVIGRKPSA